MDNKKLNLILYYVVCQQNQHFIDCIWLKQVVFRMKGVSFFDANLCKYVMDSRVHLSNLIGGIFLLARQKYFSWLGSLNSDLNSDHLGGRSAP